MNNGNLMGNFRGFMGYDIDIPYNLPYYIYMIIYLVGGLEHYFFDFPYVGKNDPN